MHEPSQPALKRAVEVVVPTQAPDFSRVYARSSMSGSLKWTSLGLTVAAVAAAFVLTLALPPSTPSFDHQVLAFVDLVYED